MARNTLRLDTSGFEGLLRKLDSLGGNVQRAVEDALEQASQKITSDTEAALATANLPAGGRYYTGQTSEAVVHDSQIHWEGQVGWVPVGFEFSKPGAGGYLITGTPRMQPDYALNKMYKQKRYMNQIQKDMGEKIMDYVIAQMEGG